MVKKAREEENKNALKLVAQMRATMEKEKAVVRDCRMELITLVNSNKNTLSAEEIIKLGEKMKKAK